MRAKDLRAKMPVLWDAVSEGVFEDLRLQKKIHKFDMSMLAATTIARNAAFIAVSMMHSLLTRRRA